MSNKQLIARARASLEGVTGGPWGCIRVDGAFLPVREALPPVHTEADRRFIAEARTLVPELLDALERAEAECERLRAFVRDEIGHMDTWDRKGLARRWRAALDGKEALDGE